MASYNVNKVRFRGGYGKIHHTYSSGRMSNLSREIYNDVIRFEEEIATMHIKISGVVDRVSEEDGRKR